MPCRRPKYLSSLPVTSPSFAPHLRKRSKKGSPTFCLVVDKAVKVLQVSAGNDRCASGFLRKVEEALRESSLTPHPVLEPVQANS